jgi:DNA-binding HxlR family transcriptional regulator
MARRAAAPATLTAHHDCEFREVLDRVGDKWSLLVIAMLEQRPTPRARFSELKRSIPGISRWMLTATLRNLERDGLLTRHVYAAVRLGSSTRSRHWASSSCSRSAGW